MKKILCVLLTFVLCFTLFGCGEKEEAQVENTIEIGGSREDFEPTQGGKITTFSYRADTLCPILSTNIENIEMLNIVYEGLVTLDGGLNPQGKLATGWSVSEDGLLWTVTLRDNVRWHDGTMLSAMDVIYTVEQIKKADYSYYKNNVSKIAEIDGEGNKVHFTLYNPCSNFVNLLTFPVIKYSESDADKENFAVCGTGPFAFSTVTEGNYYRLVKNQNWWGGLCFLDEINVRLLPDRDTAMYAFTSGEIDICRADSEDWYKNIDAVNTSHLDVGGEEYIFIGLNNQRNPFDDGAVKYALSGMIDREDIIRKILSGKGIPANVPVRDDWFMGNSDYTPKKNVVQAEKVLDNAGWRMNANGNYTKNVDGVYKTIAFDILVNKENDTRVKIAEEVAKALSELGIAVTVTKVDFSAYNDRIASGNYDAFIGEYKISPELDFRFMLGEENVFRYDNPKMTELILKAKGARDKDGIIESYDAFGKYFRAVQPIIGICFRNDIVVYNTRLKGILNPFSDHCFNDINNIYVN